jgi:hypothetical protein
MLHMPPDSTVSEDAGIEPKGLLRLWHSQQDALTNRLDLIYNSARSHPQLGLMSSTSRLDLIHNLARSHPQSRLDLIHNSARSQTRNSEEKGREIRGHETSKSSNTLI